MPRFVLLYHECPPSLGKRSHWDLMLERDGVLLTWNLLQLPIAWGGNAETLEATRLANHRIAYLDYEGPVSDNRGTVSRVEQGKYKVLSETDDVIDVRLQGERSQITITAQLPRPQQPPH